MTGRFACTPGNRASAVKFKADDAPVSGRIEADFFSGDGNELISNSRHLRLRHAFFEAGNWLFGQTWSLMMDRDFIAYGTTVDLPGRPA